jgi:hypothetical protein
MACGFWLAAGNRTLLLYRSEQTFVKPETKKICGGQTTAPFQAYIKLEARHGMRSTHFAGIPN